MTTTDAPQPETPELAEPAEPSDAAPAAPATAEADDGVIRAGTEEMWVEARGQFLLKDTSGYIPRPESDELRVELSLFEGPLDLLLHLLDRHTFDIFDIPIARIAEEYLKVLDDMRTLDLDIAGEFLVMASRLAHIKSRMLLPPEPSEDEEGEEIDPRLELVRRLLEYQRFKEVAEQLGELPQLGRDTFGRRRARPDVDMDDPDDELGVGLREFDVIELIGVFEEILRRSKKQVIHEVIAERLSVGARINELFDFARTREHFTFRDAVDQAGGVITKQTLIVTFLAILEMARLKLLRVHQPDDGNQIYVTPILENFADEDGNVETDFDARDEPATPTDPEVADDG